MRQYWPMALLLACSPTPAQKPPDNSLPPFDASAVVWDAGPGPVAVTVFLRGAPEPGVLVAFQDASGAVSSTAKTDAKGTAMQHVPAGSQVTVFLGSPSTFLALYTYVGVEPGDALSVLDPGPGDVTATLTAMPANPPPSATSFWAYIGACSAYFGQPPVAINATPSCLGMGKFPLLVLAQGSGPPSLAYAFSKDNTVDDLDASTTKLALSGAWATTTGTWTINAPNVPAAALSVDEAFTEIANGVGHASQQPVQLLPDAGPPPLAFETHPGYPDFVQSEVSVSFAAAVSSDVELVAIATRTAPPKLDGSATIDLAKPLPAITTTSADFKTDPTRPTVSWNAAASLASADGTFVHFDWMQQLGDSGTSVGIAWQLVIPASATSVKMPSLPPEASVWTPNASAGQVSTPTVVTLDGLLGYARLRQFAAHVLPKSPSVSSQGAFMPPLPKDATVRLTMYGPGPN